MTTDSSSGSETPQRSSHFSIDLSSGGLSSALARERLAKIGLNTLQRDAATPAWRIFARQFGGALVWVLLAACAVSAALGEALNAAAIGAVVVLNALIGFFQEHRSERAMLALRAMTAPRARVRRDGRDSIVTAEHMVPGDVLVLEAGDIVAAERSPGSSATCASKSSARRTRLPSRRVRSRSCGRASAPPRSALDSIAATYAAGRSDFVAWIDAARALRELDVEEARLLGEAGHALAELEATVGAPPRSGRRRNDERRADLPNRSRCLPSHRAHLPARAAQPRCRAASGRARRAPAARK